MRVTILITFVSVITAFCVSAPLETDLEGGIQQAIFGHSLSLNTASFFSKNNYSGNQTLITDSFSWGGYEYWADSGYNYYSVNSYVNVEPVQTPSNKASGVNQELATWIGLLENPNGSQGLIQLGYIISPDDSLKDTFLDGTSVTVPSNNAYLVWEYLDLNGNSQNSIEYAVGVQNSDGSAAIVPTGSTLYLSISTNANSQGSYNQVSFVWSDSDSQYYSQTVSLPATVQTHRSAFMVEAPAYGSLTAQIAQFNTVSFYNNNLREMNNNGNFNEFTTNTPWLDGNYVRYDLVQQYDWLGQPSPFVPADVTDGYSTSQASLPGAYEPGWSVAYWDNSDYNIPT